MFEIGAIWATFIIGYYFVLPLFGYTLGYSNSPVVITLYYLVCSMITIAYFWKTYMAWFRLDSHVILYAALSILFSFILWFLVALFSLIPLPQGLVLHTYSDVVLATPYFFLPKSIEIFIQQLFIAVFVLEVYMKYKDIRSVFIGYFICFGGAHVLLFILDHASIRYSILMSTCAFLSTAIFPYLMLRVRGGFIFAYVIHFTFYVVLATLLHIFPPVGYVI